MPIRPKGSGENPRVVNSSINRFVTEVSHIMDKLDPGKQQHASVFLATFSKAPAPPHQDGHESIQWPS